MARRFLAVFLAVLISAPAQALVLEVRRTANIIDTPVSGSTRVGRVEGTSASPIDVILVGLERENGYYHVFIPDSSETGWIHKSRGRLRADEARDTVSAFSRETFEHWVDADDDCQDAREEVLIRSSDPPVTFTSTSECSIASGNWLDPYTGDTFTDPGDIDIDHMVPLENAHLSGAWNWTEDRKRDYANFLDDPGHLLAVSDSENQSKGGKGPEAYMPPNTAFHCEYVDHWIRIKRDWGLTMTVDEAEATFRTHLECTDAP